MFVRAVGQACACGKAGLRRENQQPCHLGDTKRSNSIADAARIVEVSGRVELESPRAVTAARPRRPSGLANPGSPCRSA
jgi:hypothetical protein